MNKTITVFGSSKPVKGDEQYQLAYMLGSELAKNNFSVCTGGYGGIMEAVSKGAVENGGKAIGITLNYASAKGNKYLTENISCNSLFERVSKLLELGDGYVILQGGTGTMLELAALWEFMNKGLLKIKPAVCHSNMWKEIIAIMEKQLTAENRRADLIKHCETVDEIVKYLADKLTNE
jgi:hypothetical protein